MISRGHKNTRDDDDDKNLEKGKDSGRLHDLVLLGGTGVILLGEDERSIVRNERGHLTSERKVVQILIVPLSAAVEPVATREHLASQWVCGGGD